MSDMKACESGKNATTRANLKTSKPFCSLAYLAKSTIAINGTNDIRSINGHNSCGNQTLNGHTNLNSNSSNNNSNSSNNNNNNSNNNNNCQPSTPNVAATAKVNERGSPSLPTGASTTVNGHHLQNGNSSNNITTTNSSNSNNNNINNNNTCPDYKQTSNSGHSSVTDVFGIINEEDIEGCCDQVDGDLPNDLRRPWELTNGSYVKRVPSSLMTATNAHHVNGLPSISKLNSLDCWDYTIELECLQGPQDLQLAAELGKTLLERNKELETLLKEHKHTIEEQEQEIVYLKKHTTALREVNDSRLKVYEQLEVGIQDLERANHRLLVENTADKKHIKTLGHNIETLEGRCEELTKQLEECRQNLTVERRKNERLLSEKSKAGCDANGVKLKPVTNKDNNESPLDGTQMGYEANTTAADNCSFTFASPASRNNANSTGISNIDDDSSFDLSVVCGQEGNDEIIKLVGDLETTKRAFMAEQQRCGELEEQLVAIIQENQSLQSRIAQTSATEEMKSMHDELSILDEVRQGQMCSRCLRSMDDRLTVNDEQSSLAPTEECEEDEERSLLELETTRDDNASEHSQAAYRSSMSIKVTPQHPDSLDLHTPASPNPYRDLVEKYEALLEVQRSSIVRKTNLNMAAEGTSSAEEFQPSGEFNQTQKLMFQAAAHNENANGDAASSCNGSMNNDANNSNAKNDKNRGRTPTEFSEAETSSSGFSDETSNKGTQTDERPGYFLCSIGDGEDCKFSIYDDASPIDSRFRNRPEYRELFKEIFAVLKKAAENKEEGDKLPLLDDTHPNGVTAQKVPPVTPANEELPVDFADDAQSVISSAVSEQSFAMSECITKLERKTAKKHIIEKNQENNPPLAASITQLSAAGGKHIIENGRVLTPLKREPLDYLAVGVGIKKKNRRKNRNFSSDRSDSPLGLPTPPRIFVASGKKRKDVRPYVESPMAATPEQCNTSASPRGSRSGGPKYEWNGNSMIIYNRTARGRNTATEVDVNIPYRPSTVSQDLHKLKKLDLSYAEVLRRADACKQHHNSQYQQQPQRRRNHRH